MSESAATIYSLVSRHYKSLGYTQVQKNTRLHRNISKKFLAVAVSPSETVAVAIVNDQSEMGELAEINTMLRSVGKETSLVGIIDSIGKVEDCIKIAKKNGIGIILKTGNEIDVHLEPNQSNLVMINLIDKCIDDIGNINLIASTKPSIGFAIFDEVDKLKLELLKIKRLPKDDDDLTIFLLNLSKAFEYINIRNLKKTTGVIKDAKSLRYLKRFLEIKGIAVTDSYEDLMRIALLRSKHQVHRQGKKDTKDYDSLVYALTLKKSPTPEDIGRSCLYKFSNGIVFIRNKLKIL